MDFHDQTFNGQDILLDGNSYRNCRFIDCRMIYEGTGPMEFGGNDCTENTQWVFGGPAAQFKEFLSVLYKFGGESGRNLVEQFFEEIRRGK
jgi:hypothetical protein